MDLIPSRSMSRTVAALLILAASTGCGLLGEPSLEESFRDFVLASWAVEGSQFMGRYGSAPITTVTNQGSDSWRVEYPDDDVLGGSATGDLRITELEAYPVFRGEQYADHLHETASAVSRRDGLAQDAWNAVRDGDFQAIARVNVEVTLSSRAGREVVEQLALLPGAPEGTDVEWAFRDETRSLVTLLRATQVLFEGMMRSDDRVLDCAGGVDPSSDRQRFYDCATGILEEEFGG